jgi:glutamate/aspartate transport system substrate-binding protein
MRANAAIERHDAQKTVRQSFARARRTLRLAAPLKRMALACLASTALHAAAATVPANSATLRKIADTGVITFGYRTESPPFAYLDAARRPVGYSVDICERIVEATRKALNMPELEVRRVVVSSATRMPMLADGSIDLECGVTTNTEERTKIVGFSVTTFVTASRLLSRKSASIRTIDELRDQPVVSTLSTTSIQYLTALNQARRLDMKILAGLDDYKSLDMVRANRALAFAMDDVLLRSVLSTAPDADDYSISDIALTTEPYAIGLPHGDPVFKRLVDDTIVGLFRSGEIQQIYQRWFQSPIPPRGVNLKMPMSEQLQRVIRQPSDASEAQAYR